jgi:hypothetical protein
MDIHKIDWSGIPWKEIRKGVQQKAFLGERRDRRAAPANARPRAAAAQPSARADRLHRRRAACASTSAMRRTISVPGGLVVIPGGVTHWGEVLGDEPVINLDVFTPKRPEYAP